MFFNNHKEEKKVDIEKVIKKETKGLPTKVEMKRWLQVLKENKCSCNDLQRKITQMQNRIDYISSAITSLKGLDAKLSSIIKSLDEPALNEFRADVSNLSSLITRTYGTDK